MDQSCVDSKTLQVRAVIIRGKFGNLSRVIQLVLEYRFEPALLPKVQACSTLPLGLEKPSFTKEKKMLCSYKSHTPIFDFTHCF